MTNTTDGAVTQATDEEIADWELSVNAQEALGFVGTLTLSTGAVRGIRARIDAERERADRLAVANEELHDLAIAYMDEWEAVQADVAALRHLLYRASGAVEDAVQLDLMVEIEDALARPHPGEGKVLVDAARLEALELIAQAVMHWPQATPEEANRMVEAVRALAAQESESQSWHSLEGKP